LEKAGQIWSDRLRVASGEDPRGEKMLYSATDPESYITECASVYEDNILTLFR